MSFLNRNSVLTGSVDSFCLVCEAHLRSDDDAMLHVAKPVHKKNLNSTSFLDKFEEDRVRKVKKGYYCEHCNFLMKTKAKVGPHVTEPKHCENKASKPLERNANGVLAFNKALICENAWHGLIDNTCMVCDSEFDNHEIHKTESAHILKLVLIENEFAGENVYRKVDDSTFQCLTCNVVCAQNDMVTHFDGPDHKNLYQQCCDAVKAKANEPKDTPKTFADDRQNKENDFSDKEDPKKTQDQEETQTPELEKKKEQPKEILETVKKQEVGKTKPKVNGASGYKADKTDQDFCKALGATEFLTRNLAGQHWCIVCDWAMDDINMMVHVRSQHHLTMLKLHQEQMPAKQCEPDERRDETQSEAENKSKILEAVIQFQKENIMLNIADGLAACRVCSDDIDFEFDFIKNHIEEHKKNPAKAENVECNKSSQSTTDLFSSPAPKEKSKSKQVKESSAAPMNDSECKQERDSSSAPKNDSESKQVKDSVAPMNDSECKQEKGSSSAPKNDSESKQVKDASAAPVNHSESQKDSNSKNDSEGKQRKDSSPAPKNQSKSKKGKKEESRPSTAASSAFHCREEYTGVEIFAKLHEIAYNGDKNTAFCRVCVSKIPPSLKSMKEHIDGASHTKKVSKVDVRSSVAPIMKKPNREFINSFSTVENLFIKDVVINEKYCLNIMSYLLFTRHGARLRCQMCQVTFNRSTLEAHRKGPRHESAMNDVPVLISQETEFIREILPDVFHCGFCNRVESTWCNMESHLKTTSHQESKTSANWRLQEYSPILRRNMIRTRLDYMAFSRMLTEHLDNPE